MPLEERSAVVVATKGEEFSLPGRFTDQQNTLIEYVVDVVWTVIDEIVAVFSWTPNEQVRNSLKTMDVALIIEPGEKPLLELLATGFANVTGEYVLAVADSTPFLKPNVVNQLFSAARGFEAAVPRWSDGSIETLPAVFQRSSFLSEATRQDVADLNDVVSSLLSVKYVGIEDELGPLDPDLQSFLRVEDRKGLERALSLLQGGRPGQVR